MMALAAVFAPLHFSSGELESVGLIKRSSSAIAITADGQHVLAANPDSGTVSIVKTKSSFAKVAEILVGKNPTTVAVDAQGWYAYVANAHDDSVSIIDLPKALLGMREVGTLRVGDEPHGVLVSPDGAKLLVSEFGRGSVAMFRTKDLELVGRVFLGGAPRGLALTDAGDRLYVTDFFTGEIHVIDVDKLQVVGQISTGMDGNLAQTIVLDPAQTKAYVPHSRSNASNQALLFDTTVFPVVSVVDVEANRHLARERIALDIADRPVGIPLDAALGPGGKLYVLNAGSNDLSVIDLSTRLAAAHIEVGDNPRGVVVSPDGRFAYVNNTLSGTMSVIDTGQDEVVRHIPITDIPLADDVLGGKILFNSSARADLAKDQWISCATCHFDARMDRRTWFFKDGPRNTPSLLGVGETLPLHWSGDLDELQDVEATIRTIQAGTGLADGPSHCDPACDQGLPNAGRSMELESLAAYLRSLSLPPNPNVEPDGALTPAAERGKTLFFSPQIGCASCHVPPLYTDLLKHDVGTGASPLEAKGAAFDTPSLRGIYQTAPYLHDGSAPTLKAVLTTHNPKQEHGATFQLSEREIEDLVAFLESISGEDK